MGGEPSTNEPEDEKFIPGQHYKFEPPVETDCISVAGGEWKQKRFAEGWCLQFEKPRNAYAFQGKPVDEELEHYFLVEWDKGSVAENIPPPKLRVVK